MSSWSPAPDIAQQQPLPAGRTTNTWAIWVIAVLPLIGIVLTLLQDPAGQIRASVEQTSRQLADPSRVPVTALHLQAGTLVSYGVSLVAIAVQVLLAVADNRALGRLGVVRPFHWAWAFLNPTYIIGRHVVVRRRVHGSLAPLWVWIVTTVVSLAVVFTVIGLAVATAVQSLR